MNRHTAETDKTLALMTELEAQLFRGLELIRETATRVDSRLITWEVAQLGADLDNLFHTARSLRTRLANVAPERPELEPLPYVAPDAEGVRHG